MRANEPMVEGYFSHPALPKLSCCGCYLAPGKGIYSMAYGRLNDAYKDKRHLDHTAPYALPNEAEFEYAARGGRVGYRLSLGWPLH